MICQRSVPGLPWSVHQAWAASTSSHSRLGPYWCTGYGVRAVAVEIVV